MDSRTFWKIITKKRSLHLCIWLTTFFSAVRSNVVNLSEQPGAQHSHFKVRGRSFCKDGFVSVLCSQRSASAVTAAGGEGRAGIWWWSKLESPARQESPQFAAMEMWSYNKARIYLWEILQHMDRSWRSTCTVEPSSWGCYCSSNQLHGSHLHLSCTRGERLHFYNPWLKTWVYVLLEIEWSG